MTNSPKDLGKPQLAQRTARSAIRKKETIALPVLLDAIALRGDSTATEAAEVLFEILGGTEQRAAPPVYDAEGDGLAKMVPASKQGHALESLANSKWWRKPRYEQDEPRATVDHWRLRTEDANECFALAVATLRGMDRARISENLTSALEELNALADREAAQIVGDTITDSTAPASVRSGGAVHAASGPGYLDPTHARYAPKLAAAVQAWIAVDDPKGKHPKQALAAWLREHAAKLGLTNDDGKPNEQGIDECAKVANWQPEGGAPKTPGR